MNSQTKTIPLDANGNEIKGGAGTATVIYQSPNGGQIEDWGMSEAKGHEGRKRYAIVRRDGVLITTTPRGFSAAKALLAQLETTGAIDISAPLPPYDVHTD